MVDNPNPSNSPPSSHSDPDKESNDNIEPDIPADLNQEPSGQHSNPPVENDSSDQPRINRRRPVYEPTLLADKKRFRVPGAVAIPLLFILSGVMLYVLIVVPRQRRHFVTTGKVIMSAGAGPSQPYHLWSVNADGTGAAQITAETGSDTEPVFAPDGNQLAFTSTSDKSFKQLFVADPDGTNRTQLTRTTGVKSLPEYCPSDYSTIGFTVSGVLETINIGSQTLTRLLPLEEKPSSTSNDSTSADVIGNVNIPKTVVSYAWSPGSDASKQELAAVEDTTNDQKLILIPSLSGDPVETTDGTASGPPLASSQTMSLTWSPNGDTLALAMLGVNGVPGDRPFSGIFLLNSSGKPLGRPPVFGMGSDQTGPQNPVFSSDGKTILCEIWQQPDVTQRLHLGLGIVPTDGSQPPRLVMKGDVEEPKFSEDGRYVFFLTTRKDGGRDLMRVDTKTNTLNRVSNGVQDVSGYDISPQK